jgi:hypothetical protein
MRDWKRIIVGDAFKTAHRDWYRDLFLIWPFLLFSIATVSALWDSHSSTDRTYAFRMVACAIVVVLIMKERAIMLLAASGYVGIRFGVAAIFYHDWRILFAFATCAAVAFGAFRIMKKRNWETSYVASGDLHVLDLLVGGTGLAIGIVIMRWMST